MTEPQYSFLRRDADRARLQAQQVQVYTQVGKVPVWAQTTSDESTFLVTFANPFIEEPVFTFGSSLDKSTPSQPGSFPTASATVLDWTLIQSGPAAQYKAALVGVVTGGTATQKLWIHYSFVGKAISFASTQTNGVTNN